MSQEASVETQAGLECGYRQIAADAQGEAEALEWIEALIGDVSDEVA